MNFLGVDEKRFLRGQNYVSVTSDIDGACVLEVEPERSQAAVVDLLETLELEQKQNVAVLTMDIAALIFERLMAQKCSA